MTNSHEYSIDLRWTGNRGQGTEDYRGYGRDHVLSSRGKPPLLGSSDPVFRGDASRYNPEELFVGSLSACHMLWYLHLCADHGIVVEEYEDRAEGRLELAPDGGGRFTRVTLHPRVTLSRGDPGRAASLHDDAHAKCFLARSVNFPVEHLPRITVLPRNAPRVAPD